MAGSFVEPMSETGAEIFGALKAHLKRYGRNILFAGVEILKTPL
jgi:hypothetical protein